MTITTGTAVTAWKGFKEMVLNVTVFHSMTSAKLAHITARKKPHANQNQNSIGPGTVQITIAYAKMVSKVTAIPVKKSTIIHVPMDSTNAQQTHFAITMAIALVRMV